VPKHCYRGKVVGSNPAGPTKCISRTQRERIVNFLFYLKKKGYRESTLEGYSDVFKHLARNVNIDDVEAVKAFIANKQVSEARKQVLVDKYAQYCKWRRFPFDKPIYKAVKRLPFIPTEKEIDALITANGKKTSTFLQVLKETGARPGEVWALKWTDIDLDRNIVNINDPEKNSLPRTFKVCSKLMTMLNNLPHRTEFVFRENQNSRLRKFARNFYKKRITLSEKLQNPRLRKINLRTFRHWKATIEYHKTKDILHVKRILGHVNIQNTLIYTHLVEFEDDNFVVKTARTIKEACQLIEAGFEYVTDMEDTKLFRKRK